MRSDPDTSKFIQTEYLLINTCELTLRTRPQHHKTTMWHKHSITTNQTQPIISSTAGTGCEHRSDRQ